MGAAEALNGLACCMISTKLQPMRKHPYFHAPDFLSQLNSAWTLHRHKEWCTLMRHATRIMVRDYYPDNYYQKQRSKTPPSSMNHDVLQMRPFRCKYAVDIPILRTFNQPRIEHEKQLCRSRVGYCILPVTQLYVWITILSMIMPIQDSRLKETARQARYFWYCSIIHAKILE